jgi:hypothetical protein
MLLASALWAAKSPIVTTATMIVLPAWADCTRRSPRDDGKQLGVGWEKTPQRRGRLPRGHLRTRSDFRLQHPPYCNEVE